MTRRRLWIALIVLLICSVLPRQTAGADAYEPEQIPLLKADYVTGNLQVDSELARNVMTWQMDHGGWYKFDDDRYKRPWNGEESRSGVKLSDGTEIGIIDNNATVDQILFLALMYRESGDPQLRASVMNGIDFLLRMQYDSGGWPQVYPANNSYADYVTFNDNAMMRVMNMLKLVAEQRYPFDSDVVGEVRIQQTKDALEAGLDYILNAQIEVDGYPTAWSAQHDPITYEAKEGRIYEHPSLSGSESVAIVQYLLAIPDPSDNIKKAIVGALRWFDRVKLEGYTYEAGDPRGAFFYYDGESVSWYRFYQIGTNHPIFSGRDGMIKHSIQQLEKERADGYRWAGDWAKELLQYIDTLDYYKEVSYQLDVERLQKEKQRKAEAEADAASAAATEEHQHSADVDELENTKAAAAAPSAAEASDDGGRFMLYIIPAVMLAFIAFEIGRRLGRKASPVISSREVQGMDKKDQE